MLIIEMNQQAKNQLRTKNCELSTGIAEQCPSLLDNPEVQQKKVMTTSWQVVVYNDPVNLMSYVTMVFRKIFGFSKKQAEKHMLEVHHKGRSIVWVGDREQAELYVEKLHSFLLTAVLEKVA